jgi:hypothetical protein
MVMLVALLKDEGGRTAAQYALFLAVVGFGAVLAFALLGHRWLPPPPGVHAPRPSSAAVTRQHVADHGPARRGKHERPAHVGEKLRTPREPGASDPGSPRGAGVPLATPDTGQIRIEG